jgi:DNA-binding transcriptional ArsR family regulator
LQEFHPSLSVVKSVNTGGEIPANDKNVYSPHKADDAFATGTSRYMKDRIKDISQALDVTFPQAQADYTKRGLGEGVLLAFDTWLRLGDFTAQEYAEETGLKLSTVRGPLRYAETMGLAETEREGSRGPKVYSFVPEFWEKIDELAPNLRTYRLSDQRENKRLEAAQQWVKKELSEAQDTEQTQRLDKRYAHLAKQRLPHLERLYPSMTPKERERLAYEVAAYKRSAQTEQAIRTERSAQRTEHRDDVTMIRELAESIADIGTPLEQVFNEIMKYGVFDGCLVRSVLQSSVQMANYETLDDVRGRLRSQELITGILTRTPVISNHQGSVIA